MNTPQDLNEDVEEMQRIALSKGQIVILSPEPTGKSMLNITSVDTGIHTGNNTGGDYFEVKPPKNRTDTGEDK